MRRFAMIVLALVMMSACGAATPNTPTAASTLSREDTTATGRAINFAKIHAAMTKRALMPQPTSGPVSETHTPPTVRPTEAGPEPVASEVDSAQLPSPYTGSVPSGARMRLGQGTLSIVEPSPKGDMLAVGSSISVTAYRTDNGQQMWVARSPEGVNHVVWSSDGQAIAAGLDDGSILVLEASTGARSFRLPSQGGTITSVAWSPDRQRIVATESSGLGMIWDATTGSLAKTLVRTEPEPPPSYISHGINSCTGSLSPDGSLFATTYEYGGGDAYANDNVIIIWDAVTGKQLRILRHGAIADIVWSPDSRSIYDVSTTVEIIRWDALTGEKLWTSEPDSANRYDFMLRFSLSADGRRLATWGYNQPIEVTDTSSGKMIYAFEKTAKAPKWLPTDDILATYDVDQEVLAFRNPQTGEVLRTISGAYPPQAFTPDGASFYALAGDNNVPVQKFNAQSGQIELNFTTSSKWVQNIAWSPDGRWLAAGSTMWGGPPPPSVTLWDTTTGEALQAIELPGQEAASFSPVSWSPDGRYLAIGNEGTSIWDVEARRIIRVIEESRRVFSLAWSPDGKALALGFDGGISSAYDPTTGDMLHQFQIDFYDDYTRTFAIAWSPDARTVVTGDSAGHLTTFDVATDKAVANYAVMGKYSGAAVQAISFSPDGSHFAAAISEPFGGEPPRVLIWRTGDELPGDVIADPTGNGLAFALPGITSVSWSPKGNLIALSYGSASAYMYGNGWNAGNSSAVLVWDLLAGKIASTFEGHTGAVQTVAFSPDGSLLASGSLDGTVIIWDVAP